MGSCDLKHSLYGAFFPVGEVKRAADLGALLLLVAGSFLMCSICVTSTCVFLIGQIITEQIEIIKTMNH